MARKITGAAAALAGAVGAQPIPVADMPVLTGMQVLMVTAIAKVAGRRLDGRAAAEFIGALGANVGLGFALKELARALSKLWVGPGNLISGSIAAGATWGIGEAAIAYFIDGASKKQARRVFRERMSDQPPGADPSDGVVDEGPDAIGPDTEAPDKSW